MDVNEKTVGIGTGILTFILLIFRGGRAIENLAGRVQNLEDKPEAVTVKLCDERRKGCQDLVTLQFNHGAKSFEDLTKAIAKVDEKNDERHKEIMGILREMSR